MESNMRQANLFNKPRKKQAHHESDMQVSCVRWFRYQYPKYSKLLFSIPNGAHTSGFQRQILVAQGMVNGVADLMFAYPSGYYHSMFIEMKHGKNKQSQHQKDFQKAAGEAGFKYVICYSFDEFQQEINQYLN